MRPVEAHEELRYDYGPFYPRDWASGSGKKRKHEEAAGSGVEAVDALEDDSAVSSDDDEQESEEF